MSSNKTNRELLQWEMEQFTRRILDHYRWIQAGGKGNRAVNKEMIAEDLLRILQQAGMTGGEHD